MDKFTVSTKKGSSSSRGGGGAIIPFYSTSKNDFGGHPQVRNGIAMDMAEIRGCLIAHLSDILFDDVSCANLIDYPVLGTSPLMMNNVEFEKKCAEEKYGGEPTSFEYGYYLADGGAKGLDGRGIWVSNVDLRRMGDPTAPLHPNQIYFAARDQVTRRVNMIVEGQAARVGKR